MKHEQSRLDSLLIKHFIEHTNNTFDTSNNTPDRTGTMNIEILYFANIDGHKKYDRGAVSMI